MRSRPHIRVRLVLTADEWQAARAMLTQSAEDRRAAVATDGRGVPLLRGLVFTTSGECLIPTRTTKKGQCYRYYTASKGRHLSLDWIEQRRVVDGFDA